MRGHAGGGCVEDKLLAWLSCAQVDPSSGVHVWITLLWVAMAIIRGVWD